MDYFSVIVLVLVVFIFISDRKHKSITEIEMVNKDIFYNVNKIKQSLEIIKLNIKDINYNNIRKIIKKIDKEYIIIQNKKVVLDEKSIDEIIANYITVDENPSGFNITYRLYNDKSIIKKIYVDIINYLNIFNKKELATFGVLICKMSEFELEEKSFKKRLISFVNSEVTYANFYKKDFGKKNFKKIYLNILGDASFSVILRIILLILSGTVITTNLIYSIFNAHNNFNLLIVSSTIYYCYSFLIRYIYKPIGKHRIFASYIFPIYFLMYLIVGVYEVGLNVIKKVQAT